MTSKIQLFLKSLKIEKWPSRSQRKQFFRILNVKEKVVLLFLSFAAISSLIFLLVNFYFKNTEIKPALGGVYVEGIIGQPRFINPVYASLNDADRDLSQLIFSGLMDYDQNGKLYPELAKSYEIKEDGRVFEFYLKDNVSWQDGQPLTADDIVFTVKTIQNPDFKSPIRPAWLGVEVEKISDSAVRFTLKDPSAIFLENLNLKILPQHIWQDISAQNFPLTMNNLQPVGSGPFKLSSIEKDDQGVIKSVTLTRNPNYFGETPKIQEIVFYFFENEESLISNIKKMGIEGFAPLSDAYQSLLNNGFLEHQLSLPRYFALFFNPEKSTVLSDKSVREALNYGTDKKEILEKVLGGQGKIIDSPILPEIYGFNSPTKIYEFNLEKAKSILDAAGFTEVNGVREKTIKEENQFKFKSDLKVGSQGTEVEELQKCLAKDPEVYPEGEITGFFGNSTKKAVILFQEKYADEILKPGGLTAGTGLVGKSTRTKLNELCTKPAEQTLQLKFSLATVDQPILVETATLLKEQWAKLGVEIDIQKFDITTLERDIIKKRDYDSLLFGEVLGAIPDLFPFWHSSQIKDPGLNLASYENKDVDKILEDIRQTINQEERTKKYQELQDLIISDSPAIFLYSPNYIYFVSSEIKGVEASKIIDPSRRFAGIENWYINTKRGWK
jgi:ABC-type transport system substrate-binding protein